MRIVSGKKLRIFILLSFSILFLSGALRTYWPQNLIFAAEKKDKTIATVQDANTLRKELSLVLPNVLENPSYKVVFKNPSSEPIELSIDGKTYKNIKSPFTLPNLSVGKHTLVFKYTNKQGVLRILSTEILIVPRKPIIDSKQRKLFESPEPIIISGTAIPNGNILMIIDGKSVRQLDVDSSGAWVVKLERVSAGAHTFMLFSTIDGIINPTPVILDIKYKDKTFTTPTPLVKNPSKNFTERIYQKLKSLYSEYKDLLVYLSGAFIAIIFTFFLLLIRKHIKQKEQEKTLAELLNLDDADIVEVLEKHKAKKSPTKDVKKTVKRAREDKEKTKSKKNNKENDKGSAKKSISKKTRPKAKKKQQAQLKEDKSSGEELEVNSAKSIHVEKIKVALPKKGKKILSKEEFLKQFKKGDGKE